MAGGVRSALVAGVVSGVVGFATFFVVHYFWIVPIWSIVPFGVASAAVAGSAAGWAYHELFHDKAGMRHRAPVFAAFMLASCVPGQVGAMFGPRIHALSEFEAAFSPWEVGMAFAALLVGALVVGAVLGGILVGGGRATTATALASFGVAFTVGHNVPFLGNSPMVWKMWSIMTMSALAAAYTLVAVAERLAMARRARVAPS